MTSKRFLLVPTSVALIALLSPGLAEGQRRGKPQRSSGDVSDVTTVTAVEVPTNVTVKGEPVRGLTRDDFEITDNKKKQKITGFEVVDLAEIDEANPDVSLAARRHFLVFFDLSASDPGSIARAREAAADVTFKSLHPSDLVAVATFSRQQGAQLVLPFTTDRNQVRQSLETLGLIAREGIQRDPLGLIVGELDADISADQGGDGGGQAGIDAQAEMQAALQQFQTLQSKADRGEEITRVAEVMDGLSAVANMLNSVEGRKHVLYMSEGFDGELLFGTDDIQAQLRINQQVEAGQTQDVDNDVRFGDSQARKVVDRALEVFRRANCSIQAVDIGGMVAGRKNTNIEALSYMARETGGDTFANFNQLGDAVGQMLDKNSVTYLMSFQPENLELDGEYHELRVKAPGAPRGAEVFHRQGYFPPKPYSQLSGMERRLSTAQQVIGGQQGGDIQASVLAAAFPAPGKAYVPVLIEADGNSLLATNRGEVLPIELYAYALDEGGAVRDFFVRQLPLDVNASGPALKQKGLKYWGHFDVGPGKYTARVMIRNVETGATSVQTSQFEVAGGDSQGPILSAPLFPEEMGQWLLLREEEADQRTDVEFPFMANGQPYIPAAQPRLSKGQAVPVNLVAQGLGEGALSADVQLVDGAGQPVQGAALELDANASGAGDLARIGGSFKPGNAAPGEYTLLVTIKNLSNNAEAKSSVSVRVI